jgi:hypothetical protein
MNIYQYTAINNPNGARAVIESYNLRPENKKLSRQLAYVVLKNGEEALNKVASIHPDLGLFQKQIDDYKEKIKKDCEDKTSSFSSADGQSIKAEITSLKDSVNGSKQVAPDGGKSKAELLIIGGIIVIGLAIIFKK